MRILLTKTLPKGVTSDIAIVGRCKGMNMHDRQPE
jgi:hypothetical protein